MKLLNEILGTKYPIIQGGMANIATGEFAAACSNAGALGIIGAGGMNADTLRENIRRCKQLTDKPFGVNIMLMHPQADEFAQIVVEEKVAVVTTGAGNPGKYVPMWKAAGIKVIPVVAAAVLARHLEPLGIDAVLFWMVWDPKDACVEVEDYSSAVWWAAQTALRDAVGRINLAEVATRREQLDNEVKEILEEKTRAWGITVVSVEIRDIAVPSELQDALSKEAQAERERNSRLLLAEVEKDISEMFVEAAAVYERNDKALQLRTMNLIYESVKEKGGLVIAPSAFGEAFNNIDGFLK